MSRLLNRMRPVRIAPPNHPHFFDPLEHKRALVDERPLFGGTMTTQAAFGRDQLTDAVVMTYRIDWKVQAKIPSSELPPNLVSSIGTSMPDAELLSLPSIRRCHAQAMDVLYDEVYGDARAMVERAISALMGGDWPEARRQMHCLLEEMKGREA